MRDYMRPSFLLFLFILLFLLCDAAMLLVSSHRKSVQLEALPELRQLVAYTGTTDLCLTTEARYTRHPAVSDPIAPFMDFPGAIEHFPSGSFYYPPLKPFSTKRESRGRF